MPGFWGADSLTPLNFPTNGTTLADYVINVQYGGSPHDQIVWWGRYFDYGPNQAQHWTGQAEAQALHNAVGAYANPTSGQAWVLPIASPYNPYNINGDYSAGANAGAYASGVIAQNVNSGIYLPGSGQLYVYLDIENSAPTNVNFLDGWASAVNGYQIGSSSPLYASAYINGQNSAQVSLLENAGVYFQAWGSEPEPICSGCYSPGPPWGVAPAGTIPTNVWQYGEMNSSCSSCRGGQTLYADLDQTNPSVQGSSGYGMCDNMLYIP